MTLCANNRGLYGYMYCYAVIELLCGKGGGVFPSTCMFVYGFKWPLGIECFYWEQ